MDHNKLKQLGIIDHWELEGAAKDSVMASDQQSAQIPS